MSERTLPPPIKPRKLMRAGDGEEYITSDLRYRLKPYSDPAEVVRGKGPRRWSVTDLKREKYPWTVPTLRAFRDSHCTPGGRVPWMVLDMDQGVVRIELTRQDAVDWACVHEDGKVISRKLQGETFYDYDIGYSRNDCSLVWVARADVVHRHGFNPLQEPWYPYSEDRFEMGPRASRASDDRWEED